MNPVQILQGILPVSFAAGINFYLTVLVVGLSIRLGWVTDAPEGLQILASTPVLILAGVLYLLEFFADKIQFVDNIWDLLHTFVRPVGAGALTVLSLIGADLEPQVEVLLVLIAGIVALTSHSGKAGTRTAVNTASPLENASNVALSLAEDLFVGVLVVLSLIFPVVANVVTIVGLTFIAVVLPFVLRWFWFTLLAVGTRLRAFFWQQPRSDELPAPHLALVQERLQREPGLVLRAQAQGIRQVNGRRGYLLLTESMSMLAFTYTAWFQTHLWQLDLAQIEGLVLRRRMLVDVLEITYRTERGATRVVRFAVLKDHTELLERLLTELRAATLQPV